MASRSTRQIAGGAIISYIAIAVNIIIGIIYTPWMLNTIGASNYGLYTLAISVISIFAIDFGLSAATTRFVTKRVVEGDTEGVRNVLGIIARLYLLISGAIFVVLAAIYPFLGTIYKGLTETEFEAFKVVYVIIATYSVLSFPFISLNGIFSAYEEFIILKLCELFQKVGSVLIIVVVLLCGGELFALVTAHALTGIATIIIKLIVLRRRQALGLNWKYRNRALLHEIFGFSFWTTVVSICTRLIFNLVPSILGIVSDSTAITLYGIASTVNGYFYTFSSAIGNLFLTRVTKLLYGDHDNSDEKLFNLSVSVGRLQLVIISLIFVGFVSIGKEFIELWLGKEYILAYYCIVVLSMPDIIEYAQQIPRDAVIASNKIKSQAKAFLITLSIGIPLTFLGAAMWDSIGASIAICSVCIVRTITMCVVYHKVLKFRVRPFFLRVYPFMPPVYITCFLFAWGMNHYWKVETWAELGVKGILIAGIYIISCTVFFLSQRERRAILTSILKHK